MNHHQPKDFFSRFAVLKKKINCTKLRDTEDVDSTRYLTMRARLRTSFTTTTR